MLFTKHSYCFIAIHFQCAFSPLVHPSQLCQQSMPHGNMAATFGKFASKLQGDEILLCIEWPSLKGFQ